MILKIYKTINNLEETQGEVIEEIIGGIERIQKYDDYFYLYKNLNKESFPDYTIQKRDVNENAVIYINFMFLMNDKGQTIERII